MEKISVLNSIADVIGPVAVDLIMNADLVLDFLRGSHLLGVVLGMGSSMYLDLRTLHRIAQPFTLNDIAELHRVHMIVSIAFASIWMTGLTLIWYRTGFQLDEFTPKLWAKIIVITTLTVNSIGLALIIFPTLSRLEGKRIIDLPAPQLFNMALAAGVSMACWILSLTLGMSAFLKTSGWDILAPFLIGGFVVCIGGVVTVMFGIRAYDRKSQDRSPQVDGRQDAHEIPAE